MAMRGILVAVACAVVMGGCAINCTGTPAGLTKDGHSDIEIETCEPGDQRECPEGMSLLPDLGECCLAIQRCSYEGTWRSVCECLDWCDADTAPDAPDDPTPEPDDAVDVLLDPDDSDSEDVEGEG